MNILFVHQNFPGQFKHLAPKLVSLGHNVIAMPVIAAAEKQWQGVSLHPYQNSRSSSKNIHPWVVDIETKTIRADDCYRAALRLRKEGFIPAILYGGTEKNQKISLKKDSIKNLINSENFLSSLLNLSRVVASRIA